MYSKLFFYLILIKSIWIIIYYTVKSKSKIKTITARTTIAGRRNAFIRLSKIPVFSLSKVQKFGDLFCKLDYFTQAIHVYEFYDK